MSNIFVEVTESHIQTQKAYDFIQDVKHGASNCFVGHVRDKNLGRDVVGINYDAHKTLAENVFRDLCEQAEQNWGPLKQYVSHFKGHLDVGGISIIIAVSSPHRDESYQASRFLIEEIKHQAPVWKQELYVDGVSEWVQGHALCREG